jgi:glycosyltransferase involved in cell wall biosynthesis
MVVPIRVGGGTRVKTADGFARRCPIVATSIGAFGYDIENGKQAFVADSAEEFASACILLLKDPALRKAVSDRAYDYFLARWKWDSFATTVGAAVQECLDRQNRPGS